MTNQELIVEILIVIKSLGRDSLQWLLTTSTLTGRETFLEMALSASELRLLPSEWSSFFQRKYQDYLEILLQEKESEHKPPWNEDIMLSTSQLISNTLQHIPDSSLITRLKKSVGMIESHNDADLSIHEAVSLIKVSTTTGCKSLQSRTMTILLNLCEKQITNENIIHALGSVQLPLLQRLDPDVTNELFFHTSSFQIDDRITTLFQTYQKDHSIKMNHKIDIRKYSSISKLLGLVEAANLARLGNQIGSKHGCVITVSKDVFRNNVHLLQVLKKSEYSNIYNDDLNESTPYDIIVGRGHNHNVVPNGKGGKKRMIHAEVHAVADTIRMFEEDITFNHIFPFATAIIVELKEDTSYDDAPPCPKCELLLRAVGVRKTCHSTKHGYMKDLNLVPYPEPNKLFQNPIVRVPFQTVCDELCIRCSKLEKDE